MEAIRSQRPSPSASRALPDAIKIRWVPSLLAAWTAASYHGLMTPMVQTQIQGALGLWPTDIVRSNLKVAGKTRRVPSWNDVKTKLAQFDRSGLVGLISDLHGLSRENQAFLQARLDVGADPLAVYKRTISQWIHPDLSRNQGVSVVKAKKASSEYRKAIGLPDGVAELSVFYCENAVRLCAESGFEDEGFFNALLRMFDQALSEVTALPLSIRPPLLERLDAVRSIAIEVGWGVKDAMDEYWAERNASG